MIIKMLKNIFLLSCALLLFSGCSIETYSTKMKEADAAIQMYVDDNGLNVQAEPSGIFIIPIAAGEGDFPEIGDKVAFHYKGYFMNGEVFDSSYEKSYPLVVKLGEGQMIKGVEEALLKMNKASKTKVVMPFYMAYKDREYAPVPPYSNLVFELELIDFMKTE